jgi:hypothetical protein
MKKLTLFFVALFFITGISNIKGQDELSGFYLNNGKNKISELNCYSFDNLSVKFPILPEMLGYDQIGIAVVKYNAKNELSSSCGYEYDKPIFNAKFSNKESGELTFFKKGGQEHCLSKGTLTRVELKYTNAEKGLVGACIQLQVYGYMVSGSYERVVGNYVVKEPTYSSTLIYEGPKLPLTNREKVNRFVLLTITKVDLSVPCGLTPTVASAETPKAEITLEPTETEKPEIVNAVKTNTTKTPAVAGKTKDANMLTSLDKKKPGYFEEKDGDVISTQGYKIKEKIEGEYRTYSDGKLQNVYTYKNDTQEGSASEYYDNGKVKEQGIYKNGKKEGEWKRFTEAGKPAGTDIYVEGEKQ